MSVVRKLLYWYRKFQYTLFARSEEGLISDYSKCSIIGDIPSVNKDCVHPCVRYSVTPFRGHHWWMVYTPYYNANAMGENPILCYGEGNGEPPTEWHVYKELVPQPETGYNSDPNMLFHEGNMYIFWRENETPRLLKNGLHRGTYCIKLTDTDIETNEVPLLPESLPFEDHEVSPVFMSYKGQIVAFANHLLFKSPGLQKLNGRVKTIIDKLLLLADLLGFYSQQKSYGIALWNGAKFSEPFKYLKSVYPKHCNHLYRPWHSDAFEYEDHLYMIMQSNQCNADICIARWNEDLSELVMAKKPLITNASIGKVGIYKPTAVVYGDNLYVYVSAQDERNRASNILFRGIIQMTEVNKLFS